MSCTGKGQIFDAGCSGPSFPVVSAQRISIKGVFLTIGIVKHVDNMVRHPKEVKVLVVVIIHVLQICMI